MTQILRILIALAITAALSLYPFDFVESLFFDAWTRLKPTNESSQSIELIVIDAATIEALDRYPNAQDFKTVLAKLNRAEPKTLISLVELGELIGNSNDFAELSTVTRSLNHFFASAPKLLPGQIRPSPLAEPLSHIETAVAEVVTDKNNFARDEVARRLIVNYRSVPHMSRKILEVLKPELPAQFEFRGQLDFADSKQVYVNYRPRGSYPTTSFIKVLNERNIDETFRDKVVFIGRDLKSTFDDYVRTPLSREPMALTTLEAHANMLDTLLLNNAPVRLPNTVAWTVTAVFTVLTISIVLTTSPIVGLLSTLGLVLILFTGAFTLFAFFGLWMPIAHSFLAVFICYYHLLIPYRLIVENRKNWEISEKHRLLSEVEELKTNFLSMMSHDLKTPIARIQGMTDIIQREPEQLSKRQTEALQTLSRSTEELLKFVTSILDIGRFQSKERTLHLLSKDPNSLLHEVIEGQRFAAESRGVKIVAELEPLFSIKMDADLIHQVFANLLENAIKYSPDSGRVLITSEEQAGHIVVQFADQGIGIDPDELPYIFTKFYRSPSVKNSNVKGSGLGLYLAKYFVELHKGTLTVDSQPGQGSTFTVSLPV